MLNGLSIPLRAALPIRANLWFSFAVDWGGLIPAPQAGYCVLCIGKICASAKQLVGKRHVRIASVSLPVPRNNRYQLRYFITR